MNRARIAVSVSLAALLLLTAAAVGFAVAARYGPERATRWAEALLAEQVGPVEIGSLHLGFHWGPAIEARDVRAAPDSEASGGHLEAASWKLSFDLTRLLRGELRVGRMKVKGLRAEIVRDAAGALHPEAARRLFALASSGQPARGSGEPAPPFDPREALEALRHVSAALPALAIENGEISWRDASAPAAALGVRSLDASLARTRLGGGLELTASGRLLADGAEAGDFELRSELPRLGKPHAELALTGLDVAAAQPWLARWAPAREAKLELTGRASAHVEWRADGPNEHIDAELVALDLTAGGRLGPDSAAQQAELPSARMAASLTVAPRSIDVANIELDLGPWRLRGRAHSARPVRERTPIDFTARGEPIAIESLSAALRAIGQPALTRTAEAISAGRMTAASLACKGVSRAAWQPVAADPLEAWPEGCTLALSVEGVTVQVGEDASIRGLRGQLVFARDRLTLRDIQARLYDDPLPTLDLTVTGIAAVAQAIADGETPRAVPPLPGWFTLETWAKGDRDPRAPPRWIQAEIEASRLDHPVLLRPVSGLRAVLKPVTFGFDAEIAEAYWGSALVSGRARKSGDPPGHLEVEVTAKPSPAPMPRDRADPAAWARATFRVALHQLGQFRASAVSGRLRMEGDRGEISEGDARLLPQGRLLGEVDLHLDRSDYVQAEGRLRVEGASLPDLLEDLTLDREVMTGTAHLSGDISAKLIPLANVVRELTGPVAVTLRDGEIRKRMNLLLALAAASDTFNPFRSREVLPYDLIEGGVTLDRGTVRANSLSLVGPAARLVATGDVNVVDAPNQVNAVVGVFFFKTLDTVLSKVPLLNQILLGKDENLMAAYFALNGPWKDPTARILPSTLLTSGPIGIVTDGLPGFVRSGIGTLRRLLGGEPAEDVDPLGAPPDAPARSSAPSPAPATEEQGR